MEWLGVDLKVDVHMMKYCRPRQPYIYGAVLVSDAVFFFGFGTGEGIRIEMK